MVHAPPHQLPAHDLQDMTLQHTQQEPKQRGPICLCQTLLLQQNPAHCGL